MQLQLIRHATVFLWIHHKKILIDPMLAPKGSYSPIEKVKNQNKNPLIDLPISIEKIIDCDAVLLTHLHRDHFDSEAIEKLPKILPVFCQPQDAKTLLSLGFMDVRPIAHSLEWEGITFYRTKAKHGHGIMAMKMAPVSGYVIKAPDEPSLYILGDTVWCRHVKAVLNSLNPDVAVSYCGKAQFSYGKPITMGEKDIQKLKIKAPHLKLVCIHMEAWNHCSLLKEDLKAYAAFHQLTGIIIPNEGDLLDL